MRLHAKTGESCQNRGVHAKTREFSYLWKYAKQVSVTICMVMQNFRIIVQKLKMIVAKMNPLEHFAWPCKHFAWLCKIHLKDCRNFMHLDHFAHSCKILHDYAKLMWMTAEISCIWTISHQHANFRMTMRKLCWRL